MEKKVVIVGANGQLGLCFRSLEKDNTNLKFYFFSSKELDVTDQKKLLRIFTRDRYDYCVNCAAYTHVDEAEVRQKTAYNANALGPYNLALVCKQINVSLIHISTDYVFDSNTNKPYSELDTPNPLSVYGRTKLEGEKKIQKTLKEHIIIRTSWLYSEYGNNFYNTMLELSKTNKVIKVVSDQIGCPTYAPDLARVIVAIINSDSKKYGIYHFSNNGFASWYDFACAIFKKHKLNVKIIPISSKQFKSKVKRPNYSLLNNNKIKNTFDIKTSHWQESLDKIGV